MTEKMNKDEQAKAAYVMKEVLDVFEKHGMKMSETSALLGAILGMISTQTEQNFPFISFLNSFSRTYHASYEGEEIHTISEPIRVGRKS